MKKIASWNEEHKSASQLRKQRQREQIEKKLKDDSIKKDMTVNLNDFEK